MRKALLACVLATLGLGFLGCTPAPSDQPSNQTNQTQPAAGEVKKDAAATEQKTEPKKTDAKEAKKTAPAGTTAAGQ